MTRRQFLKSGLAFIAGIGIAKNTVWNKKFFQKKIPGEIIGASHQIGHRLRSGAFPPSTITIHQEIVIVGGGVAGLAAAYRLHQQNIKNFLLLELENEVGGNARSGKNEITAYPWGAHYIPIVTDEAKAIRRLFEDLKIITGVDAQGLPIYEEEYLCHDPSERLYLYGRWQPSLIPYLGIHKNEEAEYQRFFELMDNFKNQLGSDNKKCFAIPIDASSQDPKLLTLDKITMREWLDQHAFHSAHLRWYINYCCRDDYGTTLHETSAWAGIHYFASRTGKAANAQTQSLVTWPEGNAFITEKLAAQFNQHIQRKALVYSVEKNSGGVAVHYWDDENNRSVQIQAKSVILATPRFITTRLVKKDPRYQANHFSYAPWLIANVSLTKLPEGRGSKLCWDNVVYQSELLGYVVATHQALQSNPTATVLTYYWPLSHLSPEAARSEALSRSYEDWQKIILQELLPIHPELKNHISRIDFYIWGHAMIRPLPNFIWGESRRQALKQYPPIFTAHSDMSGISIFEEAYTHGIRAAENIFQYFNTDYESWL